MSCAFRLACPFVHPVYAHGSLVPHELYYGDEDPGICHRVGEALEAAHKRGWDLAFETVQEHLAGKLRELEETQRLEE